MCVGGGEGLGWVGETGRFRTLRNEHGPPSPPSPFQPNLLCVCAALQPVLWGPARLLSHYPASLRGCPPPLGIF